MSNQTSLAPGENEEQKLVFFGRNIPATEFSHMINDFSNTLQKHLMHMA